MTMLKLNGLPQSEIDYLIDLCLNYGTVREDSVKRNMVCKVFGGICWVETYKAFNGGTWFNYPAYGVQVRLS